MLRLSENMAWTLHSAFVTGRATVTFRTHPGPRLLWGGVELQPSNIIRHNEAETAFQRIRADQLGRYVTADGGHGIRRSRDGWN